MRILLFLLSNALATTGFAQLASQPVILGHEYSLASTILDERRSLFVYLPAGYTADSSHLYPVVYLLDGGPEEDFIHLAGLLQFYAFPWIDHVPACILVGIGNVDRRRDFTYPTHNAEDGRDFPTAGGSDRFRDFLRAEAMPFVDSLFPHAPRRVLIGQSLGGLFAAETLLRSPDLFTDYLIVSPSVWWDDGSLLRRVPAGGPSRPGVFVAVGREGKVMEAGARALHLTLQRAGWPAGQLGFVHLPERVHGDALHEAADRGLRFLLRGFPARQ